jgi:hypothetical protein
MAGIYDDKIVGLKEQRDFARNLRMQPNNQPMGQMVGGHYVSNIGGAIAGAIGNIMGGYQEGQASEKLDTAQRQKIAASIRYMNEAGIGAPPELAQQAETPAQSPSMMDRAGALFSGNAQPQGVPAQAYQQNVAQDVDDKAFEKAIMGLNSVNPEQAAPLAAMYQARTNRAATAAERDYTHERNRVNDEFNQQKFGIEQANIMQRAQESNDMKRAMVAMAQANRPAPTPTSWQTQTLGDGSMVQVNPVSGAIRPLEGLVGKTPGGDHKPIPVGALKSYVVNNAALRSLDAASEMVGSTPSALGLQNLLGETVSQRTDPEGVATRAAVGDVGSQIIHDRTGAAMQIREEPRLSPFVPSVNDTPEAVMSKMKQLSHKIKDIQDSTFEAYPSDMYKTEQLVPYSPRVLETAKDDPFARFTPAQKAEYQRLHGGK